MVEHHHVGTEQLAHHGEDARMHQGVEKDGVVLHDPQHLLQIVPAVAGTFGIGTPDRLRLVGRGAQTTQFVRGQRVLDHQVTMGLEEERLFRTQGPSVRRLFQHLDEFYTRVPRLHP